MGKVVGERENQAEDTEGLRSAAAQAIYSKSKWDRKDDREDG